MVYHHDAVVYIICPSGYISSRTGVYISCGFRVDDMHAFGVIAALRAGRIDIPALLCYNLFYTSVKFWEGDNYMKRENYINWDEYFMAVALLASMRSKDPCTQVGACIIDNENHILSTGYNGFPCGCSDDEFPWEREGDYCQTKYPFVVHAELNAILNAHGKNLVGSKIYISLFPCNECAKAIIQAGIKEIVNLSDKYAETDSTVASKKMLIAAGVKFARFAFEKSVLTIDLSVNE